MSFERSISLAFSFVLCITMTAAGEVNQQVPKDVARYDYYRVYNVDLDTQEKVDLFQKLEEESDSLTFMGHAREVGQILPILVAAHKVADFIDILATYNVENRCLVYNFQEIIDRSYSEALPIGTDASKMGWSHYYHLETIYEWMEKQIAENSNVLTLLNMGESTQGVPIKGVKLSHNASNKAIFIESGIHAREWIAPATATFIINELLHSQNKDVQELAKNYNWIIFPCVNPDGYKYSFEHNRMWRKNRQLFYSTRGVDLNRNYPCHWNTTGSSSDPTRYDYAGPSAGSEVETQRLLNYINTNRESERITAYISLHSFSQLIMFPFGHTKRHVPNYDDLLTFGKRAAARIEATTGQIYKTGSLIETIYPSSGDSMDWAYSNGVPIAYTFELRGLHDSTDWFLLKAAEILPTATEAFAAIQEIVVGATEKGYFK